MEIAKMRVKNKYFSITPDVAEKMQKADINSVTSNDKLRKIIKLNKVINNHFHRYLLYLIEYIVMVRLS